MLKFLMKIAIFGTLEWLHKCHPHLHDDLSNPYIFFKVQYIYILRFTYLFQRQSKREGGGGIQREISTLISPPQSWEWARPTPGASNSIQILHVWMAGAQMPSFTPRYVRREPGKKQSSQELKQALLCGNAGNPSGALSHCATTPTPR